MREGDQPTPVAGLPRSRHVGREGPIGGAAFTQTQRKFESRKRLQKPDSPGTSYRHVRLRQSSSTPCRWFADRKFEPGGHCPNVVLIYRHSAKKVKIRQHFAGSLDHRSQGVFGDRDGQTSFLANPLIEAPQQRPATCQYNAAVGDIRRKLRWGALQCHSDGIQDSRHALESESRISESSMVIVFGIPSSK